MQISAKKHVPTLPVYPVKWVHVFFFQQPLFYGITGPGCPASTGTFASRIDFSLLVRDFSFPCIFFKIILVL